MIDELRQYAGYILAAFEYAVSGKCIRLEALKAVSLRQADVFKMVICNEKV